jgi:glycosyltransferase involved in cell wall biosynthesis
MSDRSTCLFPDIFLSVIIPGYNEEQNIESTIRRSVASLQTMVGQFEIILIDDCSRDRTAQIADSLAREFPVLLVVRNEVNRGQGGCLKRGFALARYDLITHNAMDYPFDFDDLAQLLPRFPAADLVVASRRQHAGYTAYRRLLSWGNRFLIRLLFGLHIRDYNFVQVYKREVIQRIRVRSQATAFITPEYIIRAHHAGYKVEEVTVDYFPRQKGRASAGKWRNIQESLRDMTLLFLELHFNVPRTETPFSDRGTVP